MCPTWPPLSWMPRFARVHIYCFYARATFSSDSRLSFVWLDSLICPGRYLQNARARREGHLADVSKRELVDFKREQYHQAWDIRTLGKAEVEGGQQWRQQENQGASHLATTTGIMPASLLPWRWSWQLMFPC